MSLVVVLVALGKREVSHLISGIGFTKPLWPPTMIDTAALELYLIPLS